MELIPLNRLKTGQRGRVAALTCTGRMKRKLLDMGVTPGVLVLLKKAAPFGDPIEIGLRGYSLSLRKSDAALITVIREEEKGGKRHGRTRNPENRPGGEPQLREDHPV